MKINKLIKIFLISILLFGCTQSSIELDSSKEFNISKDYNFDEDIIFSINETGYDIFQKILENKSENVLFSPISFTTALSMLENAATGITKDEILNVLNLADDKNLNETYNNIINYFYNFSKKDNEKSSSYIINLANSFWFRNNNLEIKESYIDLIKSYYDGDIYSVDFSDEKTKDIMNNWINDKTNELLKNTIKKTNSNDILYIINTLYFNAQWSHKFLESNTKEKDFILENNEIVKVKLMNEESSRKYYESDEVQIVSLDYSDAKMYIVLPRENINDFFKKHTYNDINEMINKTEYENINLYFPKFKYTNNNDLVKILKSLNMTSTFDFKTASFDNLLESDNDIAVSQFFQNTAIEVNENGTEAAAVTVIAMNESCAEPIKSIDMNCNKPFIFIIRDNETKTNLFLGILKNPLQN